MVYCAAGAEMLSRQFPGTLRVHIVAPDSVRIGNLMLDRRLERPAVRQLLRELDAGRARPVQEHVGQGYGAASLV